MMCPFRTPNRGSINGVGAPRGSSLGNSGRQNLQRPADYFEMREIFEPSSVKLYIKPFGSRMNPTTGLVILFVSIEPPAPTVMIATDASAPTFQPAVARN